MPFNLLNQNQQDEDGQVGPGVQTGPQGPPQASGGFAANSMQAGTPKGTSSGRFTNVNKLVAANQNNRLGSAVQQGLASTGNQARQVLQKSAADTSQQVQAATTAFNPLAVNNAIQSAQQVNTDASGNTSSGLTDDQAAAFSAQRDAAYTGPRGLANSAEVNASIAQAQNLANLGQTAQGQTELIKRFAGGAGGYTQGQGKLDQLVFGRQNNPGQFRKLSASLGRDLASSEAGIAGQAAQAEGVNAATARQTQDAINAALGSTGSQQGFLGELEKRRQDEVNRVGGLQSEIYAALSDRSKNPELSQAAADYLGLKGGQVLSNFTLAPNSLLDTGSVGIQQVANANDVAKYEGLSRLLGKDASAPLSRDATSLGGFSKLQQQLRDSISNQATTAAQTAQATYANEGPAVERAANDAYQNYQYWQYQANNQDADDEDRYAAGQEAAKYRQQYESAAGALNSLRQATNLGRTLRIK